MSSRYAPSDGSHTSMSYFFAAAGTEIAGRDVHDAVRQPEPADDLLLDREDALVLVATTSSGSQYENISTLSNWCTRKMPRVSLP